MPLRFSPMCGGHFQLNKSVGGSYHRKSYLVIICPNSHEKLTSEIRSSSSHMKS